MFDNEKQLVELCDVSNPGFDFTIHPDKKTIRVSCKKLLMSDQERLFYENAEMLYRELLGYCQKTGLSGIQIFLELINLEAQLDWPELRKNIIQCMEWYSQDKSKIGFKIGGWFLDIRNLPIDKDGFRYYPNEISIHFMGATPYNQSPHNLLFPREIPNLFEKNSYFNLVVIWFADYLIGGIIDHSGQDKMRIYNFATAKHDNCLRN